jgi:hypothetical protein
MSGHPGLASAKPIACGATAGSDLDAGGRVWHSSVRSWCPSDRGTEWPRGVSLLWLAGSRACSGGDGLGDFVGGIAHAQTRMS